MTDPTPDFSDAALARYLSGESDPSEAEAIRRWIEADPERRRRLEALRAVWLEAERPAGEWNADAMWAQLSARLDRPAKRAQLQVVPPEALDEQAKRGEARRRGWLVERRSPWGALAASLVLVTGGVLLATQGRRHGEEPIPMREVATTKGQRAEVRLGDGSRVVLGVESRLRFPAAAGGRARDVELEGEAYFEVTHDPEHPFRVRAAGTVTEDLGTEFTVRAYRGDTAVRVVVAEGRVAVRRQQAPPAEAVTLSRGDLATVGASGAPAVARDVDLDVYFAWTTGRLQFRRMPLAEVIRELERWYAIEITIADPSLDTIPLTGSFKNQSAGDVLDAVARSLDLRYRRQGDTVRLLPRAGSR